jgi:hypothetical protein
VFDAHTERDGPGRAVLVFKLIHPCDERTDHIAGARSEKGECVDEPLVLLKRAAEKTAEQKAFSRFTRSSNRAGRELLAVRRG